MNRACIASIWVAVSILLAPFAPAQEATSGFELNATVTAQGMYNQALTAPPRDGSSVDGGLRATLYPEWKLSEHWSFDGAIQIRSRPYDPSEADSQGYGLKGVILRAHATYARVRENRSFSVRAGYLETAFGSYPLRYDDAVNPLILAPQAYGYYYKPVSLTGLAGVQLDASAGKFDVRGQLVNSSPANPRSIRSGDQYANWAGGAGYTIRQGFRVGTSFYYGPYLDRDDPHYLPGEAPPRDLPAVGRGIEGEWGGGPWNIRGEAQWFTFDYHAIPVFRENADYVEARRTLSPRWYAAARINRVKTGAQPGYETLELVAAYRANLHQLIKAGYVWQEGAGAPPGQRKMILIQLVTTFTPISVARN